ncbi:MAG: FAD-binding oxidoreductase [Verrucomicrobiota bacterium]
MAEISIRHIEPLNYNVRRIVTDKPEGYEFEPGQATMVSINKDGLRDEQRPFTFTSLPSEDHLEFTIKVYPSHEGVTDAIDDLKAGDRLLIEEPWGAITFRGKGVFIAGGAGVTPMLAILRDQARRHGGGVGQLIFSNKTKKDLFLRQELYGFSNGNLLLTFTEEKVEGAEHGRVDEDFLRKHVADFDQYFYVCGPPEMVEDVESALKALGADEGKIVTEES